MSPPAPPRIVVTAAVIERDGMFLVTRRPRGVHLEGCWEFPGGKCEPGESPEACLHREILEELASPIRIGQEILTVAHDYEDRTVELHFFRCELMEEPCPRLGQQMRWVTRRELGALEFPPADAELIVLLERAGTDAVRNPEA
ncbi:MAG TPA: (deoxy)nucleoside triphosphate pyrophosphohydrolase [Vicinamibacterales bacterium]|nr:(deoxy)nucleoside triphosphate pyrophosphohydrolase [Vicinamibacterales bacterium]